LPDAQAVHVAKPMHHYQGEAAPSFDMRDLFSVQLQRLAGLSTRIAAMTIPQHFNVTLLEWRTLAILDYLDSATLVRVARHAGVLKSQMSRVVSQLAERGLLVRQPNPDDGRSSLLHLTAAGQAMVQAILEDSSHRNERMLEGLDAAERAQLVALIQRVHHNSLGYFSELQRLNPGKDDETE
jgi:DNA-binding MarR family transcriptional regulator